MVEIAIEKEIIKNKTIIVDATHTKARYNHKTPKEILMDQSKRLRKVIYSIDEEMKNKFHPKPLLMYCRVKYLLPEAHRGSGNRRAYHPISKGKRAVKSIKGNGIR